MLHFINHKASLFPICQEQRVGGEWKLERSEYNIISTRHYITIHRCDYKTNLSFLRAVVRILESHVKYIELEVITRENDL